MANSSTQLNDDATDLSTLQAQIDLSMSVAHDMISSWVKPSKQQVARPKKDDVEEILKEYIHRPPRYAPPPFRQERASTCRHHL